MKGTTHQIFGVTCYLFSPFNTGHLWLDLPLVAMGALIPDIDHPKSILGRMVQPISQIIYQFAGHRGPFHSLLFMGMIGYLLLMLNQFVCQIIPVAPSNMWAMLVFGSLTHLLGDSIFGASGVPLLWPLKFRLKLLPSNFSVGGFTELLFNACLCVICLFKGGDTYFQAIY